jgi:2-iminoacetate synthase
VKEIIDHQLIEKLLMESQDKSKHEIREVIAKAKEKKGLNLEETASLLQVRDKDLLDEIFGTAKKIKDDIYGDRVVIFAPLYIGNKCINNCKYCGFKVSNKEIERCTLSKEGIKEQVEAMEEEGQKRTILVFGEHPDYDADFIAETIKIVYETKKDKGEIRRANINAAPLEVEGYKKLKEVGIGTYQIFQETYHYETYKDIHPSGPKSNYEWRLTGLDRAMEAGIDDVGLGALFGLYDWKYEVLGLLSHAEYLEEKFNVGPHTISFPRLKPATNMDIDEEYLVSDQELKKIVAILRLAVPYTGLILTAREDAELRKEVMDLGVSQIDAGTNIEMGGYTEKKEKQNIEKEQFEIGDSRSLEEVISELLDDKYIPSFCTACYRLGRTGEHFMEFAKPGFIKNYCTPNAILTFKEYLEDYASENTINFGEELIRKKIDELDSKKVKKELNNKLERVENGERDLYF